MARTKQNARKNKGPKPEGHQTKKQKTANQGLRQYELVSEGDKEAIIKSNVSKDTTVSEYFQRKTADEPALVSLVHAVNNTMGLPLLTTADMFAAREELQQAADEAGLELYLGTASTGEGDWPIEVAQHALYKKLTLDNVAFKNANFGARPTGNQSNSVKHAVGHHAVDVDLLVELQFPVTDEAPVDNKAGYKYTDLPVGKNGERGHFIAVRNGQVYDSAMPADSSPLAIQAYGHFQHTKKVYRLIVKGNSSNANADESNAVSAVAGAEAEDHNNKDLAEEYAGNESGAEDEAEDGHEEERGNDGDDVAGGVEQGGDETTEENVGEKRKHN